MKLKKVTAAIMSSVIALGMFSGCSQAPKNGEGNEQVTIRVGSWPSEEDKENYARQEAIKENFEKEYPNIKVEGDTWGFDLDTFLPKAASGQLPDIYVTSLTEIQRIIQTGYASDVTTAMEQYKYTNYLRDDIIDCISDDSGKIYAIPSNAYTMSLMINLNLFREAGLLKEDSTPMIPETWEQVAEYAQTIKQKTGQAGFSMSTMNNVGGWHFLNIAWAYGVTPEFAKQENGKWTADLLLRKVWQLCSL